MNNIDSKTVFFVNLLSMYPQDENYETNIISTYC